MDSGYLYFKVDIDSNLSRLNFLATRDILNTDDIQEFIDYLVKELKNNANVDQDDRKKITLWLNRKKQGLKDYFKKNIKGDSSDFYKKVERVTHTPSDAPEWLLSKIEENPRYLQEEEVYKVRAPLKADTALVNKIKHIIDYLVWYLDKNPTKSLLNTTWKQVHEGIKKWEKSFEGEETSELLPGEKVILTLGEYFWVELTDKDSLKNEGSRMGHCVGGYCSAVTSGDMKIYSLRGQGNIPIATLELDYHRDTFKQAKGKYNKPVSHKYSSQIMSLLNFLRRDFGLSDDFKHTSIFKHEKKFYRLENKVPLNGQLIEPEDVTPDLIEESLSRNPQLAYFIESEELVDKMYNLPYAAVSDMIPYLHKADPKDVVKYVDAAVFSDSHEVYRNDPTIYKKVLKNMEEDEFHLVLPGLPDHVRNDPAVWGPMLLKEGLQPLQYVGSKSIIKGFKYIDKFIEKYEIVEQKSWSELRWLAENIKPKDVDRLITDTNFKNYFDPLDLARIFDDQRDFVSALLLNSYYINEFKDIVKVEPLRFLLRMSESQISLDIKVRNSIITEIFPVLDDSLSKDPRPLFKNFAYNRDSVAAKYMDRIIDSKESRVRDKIVSLIETGQENYLELGSNARELLEKSNISSDAVKRSLLEYSETTSVNQDTQTLNFNLLSEAIDSEVIDYFKKMFLEGDLIKVRSLVYNLPIVIITSVFDQDNEVLDHIANSISQAFYDINTYQFVYMITNLLEDPARERRFVLKSVKPILLREGISGLTNPDPSVSENWEHLKDDPQIIELVKNNLKSLEDKDLFKVLSSFQGTHNFITPDTLKDLERRFEENEEFWLRPFRANSEVQILYADLLKESQKISDLLVATWSKGNSDLGFLLEFNKGYPENVREVIIKDLSLWGSLPEYELENFYYRDIYMDAVKYDSNNVMKTPLEYNSRFMFPSDLDDESIQITYDVFKTEVAKKTGSLFRFKNLFSAFNAKYSDFKKYAATYLADIAVTSRLADFNQDVAIEYLLDKEFLVLMESVSPDSSFLLLDNFDGYQKEEIASLYQMSFILSVKNHLTDDYTFEIEYGSPLLKSTKISEFTKKVNREHPGKIDVTLNTDWAAQASLYKIGRLKSVFC